ncbi:MAG: hypothetical protein GX100_04845 [candidate division WS1 bacterium]|jgi:uncharacterized protein (DUF608 family)|nr:hypothetical protein [candidate division WS1 bacterium]
MPNLDPLFESGSIRCFTGAHLREIAFPLGGIGTGTVSLGGRGQLRDWEIFNHPGKGFTLPYSFPALWLQEEGREPVCKVLESELQPPFSGWSGPNIGLAPGLPRLQAAELRAAYPFAQLRFLDPRLPVSVSLTAFNPLIPLDPDESGLPVAVLRYHLRNLGTRSLQATIAFSLMNPIGCDGKEDLTSNTLKTFGKNLNEVVTGPLNGLCLSSRRHQPTSPVFGTLALASPWQDCSYRTNWNRPQSLWGWNQLLAYWDDLSADGRLQDLQPGGPSAKDRTDYCALALHVELEPGEAADLPFLLAWHFPNRRGWSSKGGEKGEILGNYYATRFEDAWDVAQYTAQQLPELEEKSARFVRSVLDSTLPAPVLDAALANVSTLRTETCFRTADGEFFGFEGCCDRAGCCQGSCTHVWNYEQTTAFLFPTLSRSLRSIEFLHSTNELGLMAFRTNLPLGSPNNELAAADGQMGCLMKLYRDWRLCGDDKWLRKLWPAAKRALAFAWIEGGWDADRDGVMEGVQHNTYDIEWHGPNPQTGFWYLGALRAMEEMARYLGDRDAGLYHRLFENGSRFWDEELFNGEYYYQDIRSQVGKPLAPGLTIGMGGEVVAEPLNQTGSGCLVDQLVGQEFAHLVNLGYLADPEHVRSALASIHRYNYRRELHDHVNVARVYALNDDGVTLVCTWPHGGRPEVPFPYWSEGWTGVEYPAAVAMFYEGLIEEGLEIYRTARARYDGERRSPWDEAECGHHYARAMSAWGGLISLSGFQYEAHEKRMGFAPRINQDAFRCFWSTPQAWGMFSQRLTGGALEAELTVEHGALPLGELELAWTGKATGLQVTLAGRKRAHQASAKGGVLTIRLSSPAVIPAGRVLHLRAGAL